ncbi:hypothetical protein CCACVL1_26444 [Corchorus capsularis]|uniref:Uncharacterized protein n=1 Tax=Corchorus capsularis TaxID=210143 RepID=A0A1R3GER8_COCAP|nr:hypothetical protein CCACVL1_26444 [Corchorus capsularis]
MANNMKTEHYLTLQICCEMILLRNSPNEISFTPFSNKTIIATDWWLLAGYVAGIRTVKFRQFDEEGDRRR